MEIKVIITKEAILVSIIKEAKATTVVRGPYQKNVTSVGG